MKYLILKQLNLVTSLLFLMHRLASTADTIQDVKAAEIAKLERERANLYQQISNALDASAKDLKQANTSDAKEGIAIVDDLKYHLKIFNNTPDLNLNLTSIKSRRKDSSPEEKNANEGGANDKNKGQRMKIEQFEDISSLSKESQRKDIMIKPFKDHLKDNRLHSNHSMIRYLSRLKMKQRVEEWLKKKQEEKEAIKKYREKVLNGTNLDSVKEKCPRFRLLGKDKKKGKGKKGKKKNQLRYPCCRKCCKSSYLGCL